MGSSYTNVQLSTQDRDATAVREMALAAISASVGVATGDEWIEAAPGEPVERVVLVGPPGPWIAVHDDGIDDARPLAAELSAATRTAAVAVTVHDEDWLQLTRFRDGQILAEMTNWPGYFDGEPPPPRASGDPAAWRDLVLPGTPAEELLRAWEGPAETILTRLAAITGWSPFLPASRAAFTELRFRRANRSLDTSAPHLQILGGSPGVRVKVGDPVNVVVIGQSTGGASSALEVTFSGPAIDERIVAPRTATLTSGSHAAELLFDANHRSAVPFGLIPATRVEFIAVLIATAKGTGALRITFRSPGAIADAAREITIEVE